MPIITLTTDFGARDGYVGAMKGVLATLAPASTVVDLAHDVPRHDIAHAAWVLRSAAPEFPPGTIHVAVVDPGVGGGRSEVIVAARGHFFVGPDNGIFAHVGRGAEGSWSITSTAFRRPVASATFHGRDVFAPAAAYLAAGVELAALGPRLSPDGLVRVEVPAPEIGTRRIRATVLSVDRFGNVQLNLARAHVEQVGIEDGAQLEVAVGFERYYAVAARTFAEVSPGDIVLYEDAYGNISLAINKGNAAEMFGVAVGGGLELAREPG
jgi:S-adenosyl-L-methionine hydrolase (adenosine-forming)